MGEECDEGGGWERRVGEEGGRGGGERDEGDEGGGGERRVGEGWELERDEGRKGILVSARSVFDFKVHGLGKCYTMHCHDIEKSPLP